MQSFPSPRPLTMSCPVQSHNNSIIKLRRIGPHMKMWPNDVIKQLLDPPHTYLPLVGYKWGALVNMPGMDWWMAGWSCAGLCVWIVIVLWISNVWLQLICDFVANIFIIWYNKLQIVCWSLVLIKQTNVCASGQICCMPTVDILCWSSCGIIMEHAFLCHHRPQNPGTCLGRIKCCIFNEPANDEE